LTWGRVDKSERWWVLLKTLEEEEAAAAAAAAAPNSINKCEFLKIYIY